MSAERYEISECDLNVLAITGPEGTYYIDGENIEARAIRQQSADIDSRDAVIAACAEAVGASVSPGCSDEFRAMLPGEILAALAAVVAERDRYHYQALTLDMLAARTLGDEPAEDAIMEKMDNLPDSKNPSGHLIACVIAERDQLRARLAAIDNAPTIARLISRGEDSRRYSYMPFECARTYAEFPKTAAADGMWREGLELIARPAKDSP